ncbi:hypothetical protein MHB54_07630 [Paenibacillus sp. FSL M7-0802]|uniref:hypothetical protein n=1 Tax=Paenibacillus sp. FSL M7-0802 TaxID=2921536 RepID=UPI0030F95E53
MSALGEAQRVMVPGIHKAVAIEKLIQHLGMSREDTMRLLFLSISMEPGQKGGVFPMDGPEANCPLKFVAH